MIEVNFPEGISEIKINPLNQWSFNQTLSITGIDGASAVYQVHFANRFSQEAIRRLAYKNGAAFEVKIPNKLMREKYDITASFFATDYERASNVTATTTGVYYTRVWVASVGYYKYTARELPKEYDSAATYYKCVGEVIKTIVIPVVPRVEPCNCLDGDDPTDEELLAELLAYCNTLNNKVDYHVRAVDTLNGKEVVKEVTAQEYAALEADNALESGVLYCINDEGIYRSSELKIGDVYYKVRATSDANDAGQDGYITFIME